MAVFVALCASIAAGAALADPPTAGAQESPPPPLGHAVDSSYLPSFADVAGKRTLFVLAIGSDARPGVCEPVERCLADSIHLIGINPRKGGASVLGFPRDSYVPIPGVGTQKINNALFAGGPELVVQTVEELVGVEIDSYFLTSFAGLKRMVNSVEGIEVEIPYPMNDASSGAVFEAGPQELDGKQALAFARNRKSTPNGDFSRSENQGLLMLGALEQFRKDVRRDPFSMFTWLVSGIEHIQTDLSAVELFQLSMAALTVNPNRVVNRVTPGGIGTAGGASIVTLGSEAEAMFADIADDGLIEP
ncbi:MAG TPA: LCP family protein [Actinomycetota bacterium]|nr:LCP family protein [Actinomycetota bacterium]